MNSKPTIEELVSREYWRDQGHDLIECMGFAAGAELALDAVLRELDKCDYTAFVGTGMGTSIIPVDAFNGLIARDIRSRIRAALVEGTGDE